MPEWIPTRSSAKGRLVFAALEAFGSTPFEAVTVIDLAQAAEVTTGALYHHFGSKAALYDAVRTDVERRTLDRIEGAVAARAGDPVGVAATAALLVAFDHLVHTGYSRLIGADHPEQRVDPIAAYLSTVVDKDGVPLARVLCAAWQAALLSVADGTPPRSARAAFAALSVGS